MSRTKNSLRNIGYALAGQFVGILITFVSRAVFVKCLSADYLGVNGLFSNIIGLLSLAELGVGNAIIYALYRPLSVGDTEKVKSLMTLYKKAYRIIGLAVFTLGMTVYPFLPLVVKGGEGIGHIYLIYLLFVINASVGYFFTYKRSLIIADQKQFVSTAYQYFFYTCSNVAQCIFLVATKRYLPFLVIQIIFSITENIFLSRKADRLYPFLKDHNNFPLERLERRAIYKNVYAALLHKIGATLVTGTDNIIISSFVGIISVGLYSNYLLISTALDKILSQLFNAFAASIGHLGASESIEKQKDVFDVLQFACSWIYSFCSIGLLVLFNPFISLWLGSGYLLPVETVALIVLVFYLTGVRKVVLINKQTLGLFYNDRFKPLAQALVNLVISIPLAKNIGISGVLLGTVASNLLVVSWVEPYVLYKHGFYQSPAPYFKSYIIHFALFLATACFTYFAAFCCEQQLSNVYVLFAVKFLLCAAVPNAVYALVFHKRKEFAKIIALVKQLVRQSESGGPE